MVRRWKQRLDRLDQHRKELPAPAHGKAPGPPVHRMSEYASRRVATRPDLPLLAWVRRARVKRLRNKTYRITYHTI